MFEGNWNWSELSRVIPLVDIRRYPHLPWNKEGLSRNSTLTVYDIFYFKLADGTESFNWYIISTIISLDQVRKNPNLPWSREGLSWNNNMLIDDITDLDTRCPNLFGNWNWNHISSHISIRQVRKSSNLRWKRSYLSNSIGLTMDDVLHLSLPNAIGDWNWDDIYLSIPIINVYTHPNIVWNRDKLSRNKDIRVSDLIAWHEILPCIYSRWNYPLMLQ